MEANAPSAAPPSAVPPRAPTLAQAMIPLTFLVVSLGSAVYLYRDEAILGPVQVALFLSAAIAGLVAHRNGHSVADLSKAAVSSVSSAMGAIFILFAVGALIGTWNMSGTIATMTDWGIRILSPNFFYATAAIICAAIALGIGSSWTVMATMGVALVAVSEALGLNPAIAAGAVISGSYFGDKMSPLSETTNLAPAVAGTDLYTHIRAMMATTIPSIIIALGIYLVMGLRANPTGALEQDLALGAIEQAFSVGILTLIPLALVILLAIRKVPPTIAILAGAVTGGLVAIILQPDLVVAFVGNEALATPWVMIQGVWDAMATGFVADTGFPQLDELLSGGGMQSMLNTIWLIVAALAFGGIMNHSGFLAKLIEPLRRRARTDRGVLVATGTTAIGINVVAADQYLAIVLTGNVYKQEYEDRGIAPQTLSRQVEDTATVTSPLIPWNSCGAYAAGVLGVATVAYFPFAFFNLINPVISFAFAALGKHIQRVEPHSHFADAPHDVQFYGVGGRHADEFPEQGLD
jgi:NhaC family Na+:H+ antiporter